MPGNNGGGRRPLPTNVKLLHGEKRPSRVNYSAPVAPEGKPDLHPSITDPDVVEAFETIAAMCQRIGVLSPVDAIAMFPFAQAVVINRRAAHLVNQSNVLLKDRDGNLRKNPALQAWRESSGVIIRMCQEFGLTPSARTMLVNPRAPVDDRERLLS